MPDGSARPVPVNLRVVAAKHRDLERLVLEQDFRRDLLARLDGVAIELPPLRQRCEDVPLLIAKLLAKLGPARPVPHRNDRAATTCLARCAPRSRIRARAQLRELCQCDEVLALLSQHRGNLAPMARAVGKGRTQWIFRYGLDPAKYRRG